MNFDLFTKWYILLPLAFSIGPIFSLTGTDGMIHTILLNKGGGKSFIEKNVLTKNIDAILRGTPYWILFSSILNVFWGAKVPWIFLGLALLGGMMKIAYGRGYMDETNADTMMASSRVWNPIHKRGVFAVWNELTRTFTRYAYPSLHTITILAAVFFTVHDPSLWLFVVPLLVWMLWVNHHWFSDILSGVCLVFGTVNFIEFFKQVTQF